MIIHLASAVYRLLVLGLVFLWYCTNATANSVQISNEPHWTKPLPVPTRITYPASEIQNGIYYLILDVQTRVRPNQPVQTYQHYAEHIVNQNGVAENSQINISYDPSYQSLNLHALKIIRDGRAIDKTHSAQMKILQREDEMESLIHNGQNTLNIILDDVRVGDTIEYSFSRIGSNPVYQDLFAFSHSLSWSVPVGALQLRVLWEKPKPLHYNVSNSALKLEQTNTASGVEYRIVDQDITAITRDNDTPDWYFPWGEINFSEMQSWGEVAQWGTGLYQDAWQSNAELERIAEDIMARTDSDKQRIGEALRFVQDEIRYLGIELGENSHRPSPAFETLQRRYGDCKDKTVLLITLLKKLGVKAYPALVNTDLADTLSTHLPSNRAFDHVITYVEHQGKSWWLDPTRTYQYGSIDSIHQPDFGKALVLKPGTTQLQDMDAQNRRFGVTISDHFVLDKDTSLPVTFTSDTVYLGWNAERQRNRMASDGQAKLQKQYVEFFQYYYPDITVSKELIVEDNEQHNQLKTSEFYQIPSFWKDDPEKRRFTANFYPNGLSSYLEVPDEPSRKDPLYLTHPQRLDQSISVEFSEDNWEFDNETFKEENPFFSFRYKAIYDRTAHELRLHYHYQSHTDSVPASGYGEYRTALKRVDDYLGYGIYKNYPADASNAEDHSVEDDLAWWQQLDQNTLIFGYMAAYLVVFLIWCLQQWRNPFTGEAAFYPVHLGKFLAMWIFSLGLYPVFWFYRNFRYIKQQLHGSIMPVPRALFYSFWYYNLWHYLKQDNDQRFPEAHLPNRAIAVLLALLFLGATLMMNQTQLWLAGLVVSALICLPLANYIAFINRDNDEALRHTSRWRLHNVLLVLLSVPVLILAQSSEFGIIPNTAVVSGDRLWQSDLKRMQRAGVIEPGDEIRYFYSDGFLSVMEDGNGITQRHVFSYWREENGSITSEAADFSDIDDIDVTPGKFSENTIVNVKRKDGSDFLLFLSSEDSGDDRFIKELRQRIGDGQTEMQRGL